MINFRGRAGERGRPPLIVDRSGYRCWRKLYEFPENQTEEIDREGLKALRELDGIRECEEMSMRLQLLATTLGSEQGKSRFITGEAGGTLREVWGAVVSI